MFNPPDAASGVPIYLQLIEQVKHAVATGALRPGEQLPGIRRLAEELVMNANTVAKAYRELEHDGVIDVRHGAGAFVAPDATSPKRAALLREAQPLVRELVVRLRSMDVTEAEVRRLFESEIIRARDARAARGGAVSADTSRGSRGVRP